MSGRKAADPDRRDHLQLLVRQKRASMHYVMQALADDASKVISAPESLMDVLTDSKKKELDEDTAGLKDAAVIAKKLQSLYPEGENIIGVRMKNFSYEVNVDPDSNKIQTVYNQSCVYGALKWWKILIGKEKKPKKGRKFVLQNVSLNFEPGKMVLVLGPPRSGKTTLLKAIAGRLSTVNGETIGGSVEYNGIAMQVRGGRSGCGYVSSLFLTSLNNSFSQDSKGLHVDNMIAFVGQSDFHAVSSRFDALQSDPFHSLLISHILHRSRA
jgi:ABC-type glutathione transport system ATPase component